MPLSALRRPSLAPRAVLTPSRILHPPRLHAPPHLHAPSPSPSRAVASPPCARRRASRPRDLRASLRRRPSRPHSPTRLRPSRFAAPRGEVPGLARRSARRSPCRRCASLFEPSSLLVLSSPAVASTPHPSSISPRRPIAPVVEPVATLHHPAPPSLSIAVAPDHDRHGASSVDESLSSGVCMPNTGRSSAQRRHHPCTSTQMPCFRKEKGQLSQAASRKAECARAHAHASDTSHQPPTARLLRNTAPLAITPTPLALSTHFARGAGRASRNTTHHAGPFPPHLSI